MTPPKWYEDLYISIVFSPFSWKLKADFSGRWRSASLIIGPVAIFAGWPDLSPQPVA